MRVHRVSRLNLAVGYVSRGTMRSEMTYKFLQGIAEDTTSVYIWI
jgi:hypothetical protein